MNQKIGIISPNDFVKRVPFGGASGFILNILPEMQCSVVIFGAGANGTPAWVPVSLGDEKIFLPSYSISFPSTMPLRLKALAGYIKARRKILASGISLLYVHSPECALPFLFANRKIPVVFHQHGSGNPALVAKYTWARSKYVFIGRIFDLMHRLIYRRADWIIAIDRLCYAQSAAGSAGDKTTLLMNAVNTARFRPDERARAVIREKYKISDDCNVLLFVGRIEEIKNVESLIRAVKLLCPRGNRYQLFIAGEGTLKTSLEKLGAELQLEASVHFLGKVVHEDLPGYYNMADVFVLSSYMEGVPMVIMEALACGTPVIATRVGGVPDIVDHGSNGILMDEGTPDRIEKAVYAALELDRNRQRISLTIAHQSSKHVSNQLNDIFSSLLQNYESNDARHPRR